MSPEELEAIERVTKAALPGPWRWAWDARTRVAELVSDAPWRPTVLDFVRRGLAALPRFHQPGPPPSDPDDVRAHPDARFIAQARHFVPRLIAEVRRCQAVLDQQELEIARLRALLDHGRVSREMAAVRPGATVSPIRRKP